MTAELSKKIEEFNTKYDGYMSLVPDNTLMPEHLSFILKVYKTGVIHFDNTGIHLDNIYLGDEQLMHLMEIYILNRDIYKQKEPNPDNRS